MEKIKGINPERIKWCCDRQGITPVQLAEELKFSPKTIEKVMRGEDALTINQLHDIAEYFNRGILFFLEKRKVKENKIYSPQFRTIANQKFHPSPQIMALVERLERQRKIFISLREEIGEEPEPTWYPSSFTPDRGEIKQTANRVRDWLGLQDANGLGDLRRSIEAKNIMVFISNGYAGKWQIAKDSAVRGFALHFETFPIVAVKKQNTEGPQAFTLMHELGHLLLHKESVIDEDRDFYSHRGKEREANQFAGNLLVPDRFLEMIDMEFFPDDASEYDDYLKKFCNRWCVSTEVILRRLMDEGLLNDDAYGAYRTWRKSLTFSEDKGRGNRAYRYREPIRIFGEPFVSTVLEALESKKITLTKASSYLDNLKIPDLHRLEDYVHI